MDAGAFLPGGGGGSGGGGGGGGGAQLGEQAVRAAVRVQRPGAGDTRRGGGREGRVRNCRCLATFFYKTYETLQTNTKKKHRKAWRKTSKVKHPKKHTKIK